MSFIILLGIVSLFGDVTYEGARAVTGPYLYTLGASAGVVGLVAGIWRIHELCSALGFWLYRRSHEGTLASDVCGLRINHIHPFGGTCRLLAACCRTYHSRAGGKGDRESG